MAVIDWTVSSLSTEFGCDRSTLDKLISDLGIEAFRVEKHNAGDRHYYKLKQFWPYLKEIRSFSEDIDLKTKEQINKEIAFEEARKKKTDNDEHAQLIVPINEVVKAGSPIIDRIGKVLDRVGFEAREVCPKLDERDVDDINQAMIPLKNEIAGLTDTIFKAVSPKLAEAPQSTPD